MLDCDSISNYHTCECKRLHLGGKQWKIKNWQRAAAVQCFVPSQQEEEEGGRCRWCSSCSSRLRCPCGGCPGLDAARAFMLVLALCSCAMAAAGLASQLAPLPDFPGEALLSVAVAKAALYTALNLLRLLMRRMHYEERTVEDMRFDFATGEDQPYQHSVVARKSLRPDSVKTRELWAQIADDVLGGVPAALAFVAFNSRLLAGQTLLADFNDATIIALASIGILFKAVRLVNGVVGVVLRKRAGEISVAGICVNAACCLADTCALANFAIFLLRVAGVFSIDAGTTAWLLPVVHVPVIGKQAQYVKPPTKSRIGGPAWADPNRKPTVLGPP
ncbi:uncharacterized protein LOC124607875 [Schistocerca americana]|uniref:uncharacterized protein LOC124607875 n=1 Tax=Schistocerca americana TaxID=7009 RepID=UPI001F4FBE72|nr:uncharacterized protein LOC124607875 [Schistocerca americana]